MTALLPLLAIAVAYGLVAGLLGRVTAGRHPWTTLAATLGRAAARAGAATHIPLFAPHTGGHTHRRTA